MKPCQGVSRKACRHDEAHPIEHHTRVEDEGGVKELLELPHQVIRLGAPLHLHKRSHIATCAVLSLRSISIRMGKQKNEMVLLKLYCFEFRALPAQHIRHYGNIENWKTECSFLELYQFGSLSALLTTAVSEVPRCQWCPRSAIACLL